MAINNLLFSIQNMSPAMLNVGVGKTQNYTNLEQLAGTLKENGNAAAGTSVSDSVSLTYNKIGKKIVTDLAAVTANAIKQNPELDNDYVIVLIDNGENREARVYSRKDIIDNFEGTEKEKADLEKQLASNPLLVYNNASGLPETKNSKAYKQLAADINGFINTNKKTINILDKAGYNPFINMLGTSTLKKILASYAQAKDTTSTEDNDS